MDNKALRIKNKLLGKIFLYLLPCIALSCSKNEVKDEMQASKYQKNELNFEEIIENKNGKVPSSSPPISSPYYNGVLSLNSYVERVESALDQLLSAQEYGRNLEFDLRGYNKAIISFIIDFKNKLNAKNVKTICSICENPLIYIEHVCFLKNESKTYSAVCHNCGLKRSEVSTISTLANQDEFVFPIALLLNLEFVSKLAFEQSPKIEDLKFLTFHVNNLHTRYIQLLASIERRIRRAENKLKDICVKYENGKKETPVIGHLKSLISSIGDGELGTSEREVESLKTKELECKRHLGKLAELAKILYVYDIYKSYDIESNGCYLLTSETVKFLNLLKADKLYDLTTLYPDNSKVLKTVLIIFSLFSSFLPQTIITTVAGKINASKEDWINNIQKVVTLNSLSIELSHIEGTIHYIFSLVDNICAAKHEELDLINRYDSVKFQILCKYFKNNFEATMDFMCKVAFAVKPSTHPADFENLVVSYTKYSKREIIELLIEKQEILSECNIKTIIALLECPSVNLGRNIIESESLELQVEELKLLYKLAEKDALGMLESNNIATIRESIKKTNHIERFSSKIETYRSREYTYSNENSKHRYPNLTNTLQMGQKESFFVLETNHASLGQESRVEQQHLSFNPTKSCIGFPKSEISSQRESDRESKREKRENSRESQREEK